MRFLFVRSGFCPSRVSILPRDIRLPSDSTSRWTPLPSAGVSHCQARNGLSPSSCHPCRVHLKKRNGLFTHSAFVCLELLNSAGFQNLCKFFRICKSHHDGITAYTGIQPVQPSVALRISSQECPVENRNKLFICRILLQELL